MTWRRFARASREASRRTAACESRAGHFRLAEVIATRGLESAKPGFIDRVIHANYLRSGVEEMATFEKAAAKLPAVRVLTV